MTGSGHIAQGLPCQDAHVVRILGGGELVMAVADGCGSARRAEEGARCAVEVSTRFIADRLDKGVPSDAEGCAMLLEEALTQTVLVVRSLVLDSDPNEVATTLLLTLVTDEWLATVQVGDGATVCRSASGELTVVSRSNRGDFVNETTFLTSPGFESDVCRMTVPSGDITGVASFTDGVEILGVQLQGGAAHEPFFAPLFGFASNPDSTEGELREFLSSERVCERTDDDKTLILAVRGEFRGDE